MTFDDQDSVDLHDEEGDKHSKRGRLKDALNRTKTKITKVKEEREAKKQGHNQQDKVDHSHDADLDDFLSAGRPSSSSQRPSFGSTSDVMLSTDISAHSPRPSTSDSRSQISPRRGPPVAIPRIDVSTSTRFPNARTVNPDDVLLTGHEAATIASGNLQSALLKPSYKSRSQSSSSIASGSRRARIRGLSVGFADEPPIIIGEGGDEAEAPAIEISRAKARARSASPQGRKPYTNANVQQEARKQFPPRGVSQNTADALLSQPVSRSQTSGSIEAANPTLYAMREEEFVPKPFTRSQTGATTSSTGSNDNVFIPKPFKRVQTGATSSSTASDDDFIPKTFSRTQTGFSRDGSPEMNRGPPLPPRPFQPPQIQVRPAQLPPMKTSGLDLTKEFEMTLGLSPAGSSPATSLATEPQIMAPKPQRAPPSYDLIEGGQTRATPTQGGHPPSSQTPDSTGMRKVSPFRKPVPAAKPPQLSQAPRQSSYTISNQMLSTPQAPYQPPSQQQVSQPPPQSFDQTTQPISVSNNSIPQHHQQIAPTQQPSQQLPLLPIPPVHVQQQQSSQELFPPPPQRTKTQTQRIPQKLERIIPRTDPDDGEVYQSFADRQRKNPSAVPLAGQPVQNGRIIQPITTQNDNLNDVRGIRGHTPATANATTPMSARFYQNLNTGNAPEGYI